MDHVKFELEPDREKANERAAPRALSIEQFCARYSIGRTKTYAEIAAGRLRAGKVGRRTLIPVDSAEAWLAALASVTSARSSQITNQP